ncbi:MAG: hypothetical protein EA344_04135 [Alkalicoccus sp.]|nr:MAG: hypothetical protein EA344_04135 [Alkalicoccus sp.]
MKKALILTSLCGLLAACGTSEEEANEESGAVGVDEINMEQLEAEIEAPESLDPGEEAELKVLVTQGEELVDDASEVKFEVWEAGSKEGSDMVEADLPGEEGWYSVSYEFENEAVYHVQPHTTARGMHVMPVHDIVVGEPSEDEVKEAEETDHPDDMDNHDHNHEGNNNQDDHHEHSNNDHSHEESSDHDHPLHENMDIAWNTTEELPVDEPAVISIDVTWEEEAWENGDIRLEVWQHGDEERTWFEAEETEPGTYKKETTLEESGTYHVMVHLEDEEIHEHVQYEFEAVEEDE